MQSLGRLGLLVAALGLCGTAAAAPLGPWHWCSSLRPCPHCPVDYCAKPLPPPPPAACHGKDDYCAKPLPRVCPAHCLRNDDYCRKPCPVVPRCWWPPWFTCAAASCPGQKGHP